MINSKTICTKTLILSACLFGQGYASKIIVKNDDTAKVDVVVEPGEGSVVTSTPQIKQVIDPGKEITIDVTKDKLGNVDTFSVKGTVKMPSMYNRCSGLFMDKNYRIVFTGAKTGGTICYAEEINSKNEKKGNGDSKEGEGRKTE